MQYIIDETGKYEDDIFQMLLAHNMKHTGQRAYYGRSFYLVDQDTLQAGMNAFISWDWVEIKDLVYKNLDQLQEVIEAGRHAFGDHAMGMKIETSYTEVVEDLVKVGFDLKHTIKYSPGTCEFYHLELGERPDEPVDFGQVQVSETRQEDYDQVLLAHSDHLKKKYQLPLCKKELTVVALDHDQFVGGVLGMMFEDYAYIDMLVVDKDHRGQAIGSGIMQAFEEALGPEIKTISLKTTSFQAKDFYEKIGYGAMVTYPNFMKGFEGYIMRKDL